MTCKDLMLGDWVMIAHNGNATHYAQVTALLPSGTIECNNDWCDVLCKSVEPIPITSEILMKSGWFWDTKCAKLNHDECFVLEYYPQEGTLKDVFYLKSGDNCDVFKSKPGLIYLHQLQHALRLCGIEKDITL